MKNKTLLKLTTSALAIAGCGALFFNFATEAAARASLKQTQTVPTSYQVPAVAETALAAISETGSTKSREITYDVVEDTDAQGEGFGTPTAADLSMEEAAALGEQYVKKVFDLDMEGATVYMSYNAGTETFPRPFWMGEIVFTKEKRTPDTVRWGFMLDAVTGELFNLSHSENLEVDVPLGYDSALEKDCEIYRELAKQYAEKIDVLGSDIKEITYGSQGYGGNNPDISMEVKGENGETAILTFSRYDRKFLGLITGSSRRITETAISDLQKQTENCDEEMLFSIQ